MIFLRTASNSFGKLRLVLDLNRLLPYRALPAARERFVFETVDFQFRSRNQAGLQGGEPIVVRPLIDNRPQRAAREFGERVMRNGFAAIEKKRNFVTRKDALQRLVIFLEIANEHGGIAKTILGFIGARRADEFQNFTRGEDGFGVGVGAGDQCKPACCVAVLRVACCVVRKFALGPGLFQMSQERAWRSGFFADREAKVPLKLSRPAPRSRRFAAFLDRFLNRGPMREPGISLRFGIQAEGERGVFAMRNERREQRQFLRR